MRCVCLLCLLCANLPGQDEWRARLQAGSELVGEYRYGVYRQDERLGGLSLVVAESAGFHIALRLSADGAPAGAQRLWLDEQLRLLRWDTPAGSWTRGVRGLRLDTIAVGQALPAREPLAGILHAWMLARVLPRDEPGPLLFALCAGDSLALAELRLTVRPTAEGPVQAEAALQLRSAGAELLFGLAADGLPEQIWLNDGLRWQFEGHGAASARVLPAAGSPGACVADFLFGLAGDAGRLESSVDWPQLCLNMSLAASEAGGEVLGPELRDRLLSEQAVLDFKKRLLESGRELDEHAVEELALSLRVEVNGSRAQVVQLGGVVYRLQLQAGSWKIVALEP